MRNLFILICIAVFITGCGDEGDESRPQSTSATTTSSSTSELFAPIPLGPGVSKMIDSISIVDHNRDEKEFELRRSIGGIESMIQSYKEQGLDTVELEAQLSELRKQLKDLIS